MPTMLERQQDNFINIISGAVWTAVSGVEPNVLLRPPVKPVSVPLIGSIRLYRLLVYGQPGKIQIIQNDIQAGDQNQRDQCRE